MTDDIDLREFADTGKRLPARANSRSPAQIAENRRRIAELKLVGYTSEEIADIINEEMSRDREEGVFEISSNIVRQDWMAVRKSWQQEQEANYTLYINEELARLGVQEKEAWRQYRQASVALAALPSSTRVVEYSDDEESVDNAVRKSGRKTTTVNERSELLRSQQYWFDRIESIAAKRHKVLGLAGNAPAVLIDNRRQEVNVGNESIKKYRTFSPDDWDAPRKVEAKGDDIADGIYE